MKNLLIYLVKNLLKYGVVEKVNFKLSGEDTFIIRIEQALFALNRSEVMLLKSEYDKHLAYMSDDECKIWNRLFKLL